MTFDDARRKVFEAIKSCEGEMDLPEEDEVVIADEFTIETPFGWVFFYDSRKCIETGDMLSSLAGNAPYIADKFSGELHVTGTGEPIEHYIAEYVARMYPNGFPDH